MCGPQFPCGRSNLHPQGNKDGQKAFHDSVLLRCTPQTLLEKGRCLLIQARRLHCRNEALSSVIFKENLKSAKLRASHYAQTVFSGFRSADHLPLLYGLAEKGRLNLAKAWCRPVALYVKVVRQRP